MSTTSDVNYEYRCDLCSSLMIFDTSVIQSHYDSTHNGQKTNWRKYTNLNSILAQPAKNRNTTQFVKQVNSNDIESDSELAFISHELVERARNFANAVDGRLYKFKTLANGKAHKILELGKGEKVNFDYTINLDERKRSARTLFDKDVNINHYLFAPGFNFIIDSDEVNGAVVGLMLIEDPTINALYDKGLIEGVSVEYFRRKETCSCAQACTCDHTGVIFTGMAVITVPFEPADGLSQFVEVMHNEISGPKADRMISLVQADLKLHFMGKRQERAKLQLSNDNHLSQGKCSNTGNEDMNEEETKKLIENSVSQMKQEYERQIETLESELASVKADFLHLQKQYDQQRAALTTGASLMPRVKFSREDLIEALPAKLAETSLYEVALADAASKGVNITNRAELDAFFNQKRSKQDAA